MHDATVEKHSHSHASAVNYSANESRTFKVVVLTVITMIVEITAGYVTGSMALLADGWHMGTHALALGFSYTAYKLAKKYDTTDHFSFGTGKIGVLAGYTSALFLGAAGFWMIFESILRLFHPLKIDFLEAIVVTFIGFSVNSASLLILHKRHNTDPAQNNSEKGGPQKDHNFRAAYLHVLADTITSIFALAALLSGLLLGWTFLDPVMGIVGGILISRWAYSLIKSTGGILLDLNVGDGIRRKIRNEVQSDNESRIIDLHAWKIGSEKTAAIVSVATGKNRTAEEFQERIKKVSDLQHLSVEVHHFQP